MQMVRENKNKKKKIIVNSVFIHQHLKTTFKTVLGAIRCVKKTTIRAHEKK